MIRIDDSLKDKVYIAYDTCKVKVKQDYSLDQYIYELRSRINIDKESLKDNPIIRALRDFYWSIGIDPTKTRPSSEALVRRLLNSNSIPKINNVIDAGNIASIETLIPIGIYDLDKIKGSIVLRHAKDGEEFMDLANKRHVLDANKIVLADELGVIHLFPFRDSDRTKVTSNTSNVLIVACGVEGIDRGLLTKAIRRTIELIDRI